MSFQTVFKRYELKYTASAGEIKYQKYRNVFPGLDFALTTQIFIDHTNSSRRELAAICFLDESNIL